jgi:hypothetical protein
VEMYILYDDPSPLFHLLYMILTSNFQFLEVKKGKSIPVCVMKGVTV